jgi:hypothetical protein
MKGPGVIAAITTLLAEAGAEGITIDEMITKLTEKFPDRQINSMRSTVKTQMGRQKANRRSDEKRGLVYFIRT